MSELQAARERLRSWNSPVDITEAFVSHLYSESPELEESDTLTVLSALDEAERRSLGWKNAMIVHRNFRAAKVGMMMKVRERTARRCAEIASIERDRIKHTSHHEGLGLGCVHHCEKTAGLIEATIRREFLEGR